MVYATTMVRNRRAGTSGARCFARPPSKGRIAMFRTDAAPPARPGGHTVHQLAALSGISDRTLRYYDSLGLLLPRPRRKRLPTVRSGGGGSLAANSVLPGAWAGAGDDPRSADTPGYDRAAALTEQLAALRAEQARLTRLAETLAKTLAAMKGETTMNDTEKFAGLKARAITENETRYGGDPRALRGGCREYRQRARQRDDRSSVAARGGAAHHGFIEDALKAAVADGDPAGRPAQTLCALHREWLCCYWAPGMYTPQAHAGLGQMYLADERFKAYYDRIVPGGAAFWPRRCRCTPGFEHGSPAQIFQQNPRQKAVLPLFAGDSVF